MKFEEIFKLSTTAMRLIRCHPAIERNKLWMLQFTLITTVNMACLIFLLNSILLHDIRTGRFSEASKNIAVVIISVTINFKYFILVYNQDYINGLIHTINKDYELSETFSEKEKKIIVEYAEKGVKVCKIWLVLAIAASVIFSIKAALLMVYLHSKGEFRLIHMFDLTYPSIIERYKNYLPVFCALFAMCKIFGCYASSMYAGFDPLAPIFMLHCCGQLEVTSHRIIKVFSESTDEAQLNEKLKQIIIKLQEIYRFVDCIKTNFTLLYEYVQKSTTFLIPLIAFQIVECLKNRDTNLEFIPLFFASSIHFFFPCYYSDLLMETGERLRLAIYSCGWEKCSYMRTRKTVLFMLTRTNRPLVINTVFTSITLATFAEMCRTSYTIFNLMNIAWT